MEKKMIEEVSQDLLMKHTEKISTEVRLSGSIEELRAFQYVQQTLEDYGLETSLTFDECYISLPVKASLKIGDENLECITHSMSESVTNLQSRIVYTDKLSLDKKRELRGEIVLVDGLASPANVSLLMEVGALGGIFINNGDYTNEMIISPIWGNPVPETVGLLPDIPVISVTSKIGNEIRQKLKDGIEYCTMSTEVDTGYRKIPTLVADIKSNEEPNKFVLFSGHIDSWHYGAMDNGTANAAMLEIARILMKYKATLKRSIKFAFWSGHSHGRYAGSTVYCDTHWQELKENCIAHVNIDSVGAKGASILTAASCFAETRDIAKYAVKAISGEDFEGSTFGRAGDQSFWGTGTPSLFMSLSKQPFTGNKNQNMLNTSLKGGKTGGLGWWWHTTEDTIDKISPTNLKRDCEIYLLSIYRLLTESIIPLNQLAAVEELEANLLEWKEKAKNHLDLSHSVNYVNQLKKDAEQLMHQLEEINLGEKEKVKHINECIMKISRILVPLIYVKGNIYDHDLAVNQPLIPKLSDIDKLITIEPSREEYYLYKTSLIRNINEVNDQLEILNIIFKKIVNYLQLEMSK